MSDRLVEEAETIFQQSRDTLITLAQEQEEK
jgi:hypothetical protein